MRDFGFRAHIREEFESGVVRLLIVEQAGDRQSFLMQDGTWHTVYVDAPVTAPDGFGLPLRPEALDAILEALKRYKGDALDSTTESRVLREALQVERARVDRVLGGMT